MNSNQREQIAFGGFLAHLRARGFIIGVDQQLRLQRLLPRVEGQCAPEQLKTLLCPLFAANRRQQQEFYRAFEQYFAIFQPIETAREAAAPTPEPPAPRKKRSFRVTAIVSLIGLALAVVVLLGTQRFRLLTGIERVELPAPEFSPLPTPPGPAPSETVAVIPPGTGGQRQEPPRGWALEHRWQLRLIALLAPLLLFAIWQWWRRRRRRPVIEKAHGRRPPFTWPIELEREEWRLDRAPLFYQAARGLRRRQQAEHRQLDLERTIAATIAARGYPRFQFRQASRPPEYLILIDRASRQDHQARLFDQLAQSLEREGLFVVRYFYEGDPRICRPAAGGPDVFLADLHRGYPVHRLVLMGDGARLLDPVRGELEDWIAALAEWPERAILTSAPLTAWGRRERLLATQFALLPATLAGLAELAEWFESPLRNEAPRGDAAGDVPQSPDAAYGVTVEELRRYLGHDGFRWLCACAIYPELQWELTLKLGELASPSRPLDEAALWRLLRLPWFRQGTIPDEIRDRLVRALDPDLDRSARELLIETLERNPAEEGTFAADERRLDIAVQKAWLAKDDRRKRKAAIEEIRHLSPEELQRDYTLVRLLAERPTSLLALVLPVRLRRLFYPLGLSHFGMKWQAALGLTLLVALLAWGGAEGLIRYQQSRRPQPTPTPNASPPPAVSPSPAASPTPTPSAPLTPTPSPSVTASPTATRSLVPGPDEIGPPPDTINPEMVPVPGGSFQMGSPESEAGRYDDEGPQRRVTVKAFEMGKYEVTQAQWRQVARLPKVSIDLDPDPSRFKGDDLPVEQVSWEEANEFCARLSRATGRQYRLPTEAEWEYAARAGTTGPYAGNLDRMAWYNKNSDGKTHPVGSKQPNAWGLFDMHGNVWEWCEDDWHENYNEAPADGRAWISNISRRAPYRVIRGGGWALTAAYCRSADRFRDAPGYRIGALGFRLVRT